MLVFGSRTGQSNLQHSTSFKLGVPHHELIRLHGNTGGTTNKHHKTVWTAFIFVQPSHNTPNQRKQLPKHISGGLNVYVRGWGAGRGFAEGVILFLHPATSDFS